MSAFLSSCSPLPCFVLRGHQFLRELAHQLLSALLAATEWAGWIC